jgi:hypothetical protein
MNVMSLKNQKLRAANPPGVIPASYFERRARGVERERVYTIHVAAIKRRRADRVAQKEAKHLATQK